MNEQINGWKLKKHEDMKILDIRERGLINGITFQVMIKWNRIKNIDSADLFLGRKRKVFPGGSVSKESACNARDLGCITGLERSSGERNNDLLQYSCLENPMDSVVWWVTIHGVTKVGHHDLVTEPSPEKRKI